MKRLATAVLFCMALWICAALAEGPALSINALREEVRPGRPVIVSFTVPEDGTCRISLTDETGASSLVIAEERAVTAGYNAMYWNGTCGGTAVPEGRWKLAIRMNGMMAETPVTVGRMVPCLISVRPENDRVEQGDTVLISFYATERGTLILREEGEEEPLYWDNAEAGQGEAGFQAEMTPGSHRLTLQLAGEDGTLSEPAGSA